jgi:hypothetical protein
MLLTCMCVDNVVKHLVMIVEGFGVEALADLADE